MLVCWGFLEMRLCFKGDAARLLIYRVWVIVCIWVLSPELVRHGLELKGLVASMSFKTQPSANDQ